jgi:hypothetical protein
MYTPTIENRAILKAHLHKSVCFVVIKRTQRHIQAGDAITKHF